MRLNPEFQRNLWLELTPHRLISMPLVLGAYFFLLFMLGDGFSHDDATQALFIATVILLLWGANMTAESVLSEVRDNTWDAQRMSAMSAWNMVWGKLLGSSLFVWYGAAICFAVFAVATEFSTAQSIKSVLLLTSAGLFAQSVSMLLALLYIRKSYDLQRSHTLAFTLFGALAAFLFVRAAGNGNEAVIWYGNSIARLDFSLYALMAWLVWGWVGCQRLMRAELQMSNRIWVWLAFVGWLIFFTAGFIPADLRSATIPYLILSLTMLLSYAMIFSESKNPVAINRLLHCLRQRDWMHLQYLLPCSLLTVVLMIGASLLLPFGSAQHAHLGELPLGWLFDRISPTLTFTAMLFVLRDICIVLWLNFSPGRKRADITAALYLVLSYVLVPMILTAVGLDAARILFLPDAAGSITGLAIAGLEAVAFFWLMRARWQANFATKD